MMKVNVCLLILAGGGVIETQPLSSYGKVIDGKDVHVVSHSDNEGENAFDSLSEDDFGYYMGRGVRMYNRNNSMSMFIIKNATFPAFFICSRMFHNTKVNT
mmetsp:Transcript_57/g.96  ORF Transcript_57/g.96 Transcript_57/m.96 type:complete len:101 (-) Transcript_57:1483-1785(-)